MEPDRLSEFREKLPAREAGPLAARAAIRGARLLLGALLLAAAPANAATAQTAAADARGAAASAELAALFDALAAAPSEGAAQEIETRIWLRWTMAPDPRAQTLLDEAFQRRRWIDYPTAIALLDELVRDYPDYAEGWNQRATVRFLQNDLDGSLADIAETLAREPRHFGAMAGKALILLRKGEYAAAQETLRMALRIHPWMPERGLLDPLWREEKL